MGGLARMERKRMDQFNRYWAKLYETMPSARAQAVKAMGESVLRELGAEINAADLASGAKGRVKSWQEMSLGSGGGYAAVRPGRASPVTTGKRPHTWKGKGVTVRQVTKWLEQGHGVGVHPRAGSGRQRRREGAPRVNGRTGLGYVKGRQFYSFTKLKAIDHAIKAADKVLSAIADEVDF